jgi:hypothetical protein
MRGELLRHTVEQRAAESVSGGHCAGVDTLSGSYLLSRQ